MNKREMAWAWMKLQQSFSTSEVANAVGMDLEQCRTTLNKLKKQGFILHVSGVGVAGCAKRYSINEQTNNEPRLGKGARKGDCIQRQGKTGQQLIWNTLRINRIVNVSLVVSVTKCSASSVSRYLSNLEKAGYVRVQKIDSRQPNSTITGLESTWRLKPPMAGQAGETGPKAPILRRGKGMFDQNNGTFYPFKENK